MTEELQKQRDILAERQAEEFVHIHTLSNLYAKQSFIEGFDACHTLMNKDIESLQSKLDVAKKALERIEKYGNTSLCGEIAEQALKEMETTSKGEK